MMNIIVTTPPYADFLDEVAAHPLVSGFRLNTVMPLREGPGEALDRLSRYGKPVWVDLKGRQLRVASAAVPPYTEITLSHPIEVETPVNAFFSDGHECAKVVAVDQQRLILADGPRRLVGPGESINIIDPSLKICGTLTDTDRAYLAAMRKRNMRQVMLSFVESQSDLDEVHALLPGVELVAKIESQKGLAFAKTAPADRLMAARGDLFVEVSKPHDIIPALKSIIRADPHAIVASRLLNSMAYQPVPDSADLSDIAFLYEIGYRSFMLGDAVCLKRESVIEALNVMGELSKTL